MLLATHSPALVRKATLADPDRVGVLGLWRGRTGDVVVTQWEGHELEAGGDFQEMVAEVFVGR